MNIEKHIYWLRGRNCTFWRLAERMQGRVGSEVPPHVSRDWFGMLAAVCGLFLVPGGPRLKRQVTMFSLGKLTLREKVCPYADSLWRDKVASETD